MQLGAQLRLCQSCLWYCKTGARMLSLSCAYRKAVNHYELLGVKSDASLDEIKKAFFDKSKKLHPDSDPSNPALHSQFVELNEAYRVLSKEISRKEYDFKIAHRFDTDTDIGGQTYNPSSGPTSNRASANTEESNRYWEHFHQYQAEMSMEEMRRKRSKNIRLVGYCVVAMGLSIVVHIILFSKLKEIHTDFMDEKDRVITQLYNESKERARINSFEKQMEILRQKNAEFMEKYRNSNGGRNQ